MNTEIMIPGGYATITATSDHAINVDVPNNIIGAGDYNVTVDPNVTIGAIENTIAFLQQLAGAMAAHQA